jgi:aspartyl-tRNA(Asn)/glutamyl-tRNA(Gln) amidotransferase subunit B
MGHPGTLPVLNQQALEWGIRMALAIHCDIPQLSKFDRKSYFYPDLPKGYQISQYDEPIGQNGHLMIDTLEGRKRIGITRIHLEEDAAKLIHAVEQFSFVDFNRAGTPLMEIVTEPEMTTPQEAKAFLQTLRQIALYLDVSDADMEKGQMRCDANISMRALSEEGDEALPTGVEPGTLHPKTEIKNLNSFRAVERALIYEIDRQTKLWEESGPPQEQSTRGWDENLGQTIIQRTKEEAHDYRYFPEPDLPPLTFSQDTVASLRQSLPEMPEEKRERFISEFELSEKEAATLLVSREIADFFEQTHTELKGWVESQDQKEVDPSTEKKLIKLTVNWMTSVLFRHLKTTETPLSELNVTPENFAELIAQLYQGSINSSAGQTVLEIMLKDGGDPSQIIDAKGLKQVSEASALGPIVEKALADHPEVVQAVHDGKTSALQFLVGQVMKSTRGRADPQQVMKLLRKKIGVE